VAAVRPGGVFVAAHILGSTGMRQSSGGFFPAYPVTMADLTEAYAGTAIEVDQLTFGPETRAGYTGTAFAVGRVAATSPRPRSVPAGSAAGRTRR